MLFTFAGGSGHYEPLLALARAAQAVGHTIAFSARPWMVPRVESNGFPCFPSGTGLVQSRRPLAVLDIEDEIRAIGKGYANRHTRERAADLTTICADWKPDLIVPEELDFGAMIVAEKLSIPYASVLVIASGALVRHAVVAEPLNAIRAEYNLPPDPDLVMLHRHLVLSPFPPSFRDPAFPLPATGVSIRPLVPAAASPVPSWLPTLPDLPTVYFTLGTVFNVESGDLFQRVIAGLRELPINLIVTTGRDIDPAELGAQPANVHITQFIPQAAILPYCDLVVSHGGSGSVIGALLHALPMILIPMGADQPLNAVRCAALGVGLSLHALNLTPESIREAANALLNDASCQRAAATLQAEALALPDAPHAVTLLERLVING